MMNTILLYLIYGHLELSLARSSANISTYNGNNDFLVSAFNV